MCLTVVRYGSILHSFTRLECQIMHLYQLADDPETYGNQAAWWLVVDDDDMAELAGPFATEREATNAMMLLLEKERVWKESVQ